jgi:uncharacterized protein YecA (UPF0149 family)
MSGTFSGFPEIRLPWVKGQVLRASKPARVRAHTVQQVVNLQKIGRNHPCHCGSRKKFKKCCEVKP